MMIKILFDTKFDCIICLNGEIPSKEVFHKIKDIPIFAADGAALKLLANEIEPTKIIGDLDSFCENANLDKITSNIEEKIIKIDDQNTNDFEKILLYILANKYRNCLVLGINGGEYEHSLNNWSVLTKYSQKINLCIYTSGRYGFCVTKDVSIELKKNETVSLIPCSSAIISSKNLNWELDNYLLEIGNKEGARNFASSKKIELILHQGKYYLFVDERLPFCFSYCPQ